MLSALFEAGPTPDRVRAALPGLILVGVAAALRTPHAGGGGLGAVAAGAPGRPDRRGRRLYGLTSRVGLAAFDDPDFHDALQRARSRGVAVADEVVGTAINTLTAIIGIVGRGGRAGGAPPGPAAAAGAGGAARRVGGGPPRRACATRRCTP
ncbi:hypothetical protein [Streptosporangium vulgare]|uniref:hypothetical protein n=1 Tax=Streptosporangium vulgare TaxID=46190 RepID=UPI0031CE974D